MFSSGDEVLRYISDEGVQFVDIRFCDLPGTMQHFTVPVEAFDGRVFEDGLMFDGSSIRGFQQIHESDMLLMPDPSTAVIDIFRQHKTLNLTFFVHDPLTGEPYSRDPRNITRKAQDYLEGSGIADTRSEEHTSELQSHVNLVCRLLLEKKKRKKIGGQRGPNVAHRSHAPT